MGTPLDWVCALDVDKDNLHYCVLKTGSSTPHGVGSVPNTSEGAKKLAHYLKTHHPAVNVIIMEATGIYHHLACDVLSKQFRLWVVNPHHVKQKGLTKTDRRDARHLAELALVGVVAEDPNASIKPQVYTTPSNTPPSPHPQNHHTPKNAAPKTTTPPPWTLQQLKYYVRLFHRLRRWEVLALQNIQRVLHLLGGAKSSVTMNLQKASVLWLLFALLKSWSLDQLLDYLAALQQAAASRKKSDTDKEVQDVDLEATAMELSDEERRSVVQVYHHVKKKRGQFQPWLSRVSVALRASPGLQAELEVWFCLLMVVRTWKGKLFSQLEAVLLVQQSHYEAVSRLMTIPGVGFLTALTIYVEIGDVSRFSSGRQVAAYFGLSPRVYQSNKRVRYGSITKRGSHYARSVLGMAVIGIVRLRRHPITRFYRRLVDVRHKHPKVALTAASRKLAVLMYTLLRRKTEFRDRYVGASKGKKPAVSAHRVPLAVVRRSLGFLSQVGLIGGELLTFLSMASRGVVGQKTAGTYMQP